MEEELVLAAAEAERTERRRPPRPRTAPWLVYPCGKRGKDQIFYNNFCEFSNDDDNKYHWKSIPEMSSKSFMYWQSPSHQGWLVILCHAENSTNDHQHLSKWKRGDCFLMNPVSLEIIQLPNLLHWIDSVESCVLSSPTRTDDSIVFFLVRDSKTTKYLLVFCHPGEKQWSTKELMFEEEGTHVNSLVWFKGKLHIPCSNSLHLVVEKNLAPDDEDSLSVTSFHLCQEPLSRAPQLSMFNFSRTDYVESCDELFKVVRYYDPQTYRKQVFIDLHVFRMDFSLMNWEEVKSLGDHVLFLGERTKASCSAAELGLTGSYVYYTLHSDKSLYAFDVENERIHSYLPSPILPTPWFSPDWVTMPMTKRIADGKRRTEVLLSDNEEVNINIKAEENQTSIEYKNDSSRGELEESGIWGTFNEDILEMIASYLHPMDYMHFRAVCKANRLAIPAMNWRTSSTEIIRNTLFPPWLIFHRRRDGIYNFIDPMHNNKYFMNLQGFLSDATIRFSKNGWLLMSRGEKTLFFFNPFTRAMIHLPDLPDNRRCEFYGMSFSSIPTSSDCVVFAITEWGTYAVSIFCISRGDQSWSYDNVENTRLPSKNTCMRFMPCRNNPVFYNGVFFCLDSTGTLGVFDLEDDINWKVLAKPQRPCNSIYQCFLVECEGKLLSVFLGRLGKSVQIFRLDFSKMVWVKVENLGNYMLFISNTSSVSAIAPDSRMANKIYFPRFQAGGIVYFSLDTGSYHSQGSKYSAHDFYNTAEQLHCSWIEPNLSLTTVQELDWHSI